MSILNTGESNNHPSLAQHTQEGIDKRNSVSKEIAKDIMLHKYHKAVTNTADGAELKYLFVIESRAIKEVEFTADFTGSENIIVEQSGN